MTAPVLHLCRLTETRRVKSSGSYARRVSLDASKLMGVPRPERFPEIVRQLWPVVADVAIQVASVRRCLVSRVGNGQLPDGVRRSRERVLESCR
jgi:hypothetical protein